MSPPEPHHDGGGEPAHSHIAPANDLRSVDDIVQDVIAARQRNYGHHLLDHDIEYIQTGAVPDTDQAPSTIDNRVAEKASQLPERLSHLLTDLALFYRHGDGDLGQLAPDAWARFVGTYDWLLHRVIENPVALPTRDANNPRLKLGYELGYLARLLLETRDGQAVDQNSCEDVIRGFSLAFFDHPDEEPEGDDYQAMLESIAEAEASRRESVAALDSRFQTLRAALTDERTLARIRAALRDHELPVDETLIETIRSQVPEEDIEETTAEIDRIVAALEADAIKSAVETREALEADIARLQEITEYQGVEPAEILDFLLHSGGPETVQTIYGDLYHHGKETGVRATLNRLTAAQPGDTWTDGDFVREASTGWTLTPYGAIATFDLLDRKSIDDWFNHLYRYYLRDLVHEEAVEAVDIDGLTGTAFDEDLVDVTRAAIRQFIAGAEHGDTPD